MRAVDPFSCLPPRFPFSPAMRSHRLPGPQDLKDERGSERAHEAAADHRARFLRWRLPMCAPVVWAQGGADKVVSTHEYIVAHPPWADAPWADVISSLTSEISHSLAR